MLAMIKEGRMTKLCYGLLIAAAMLTSDAYGAGTLSFPIPKRYQDLQPPAEAAGQHFADAVCLFIGLGQAVKSAAAAGDQLKKARDELANAIQAIAIVKEGMQAGQTAFQDPAEITEDYRRAWLILSAYKIERFDNFEDMASTVNDLWNELARKADRINFTNDYYEDVITAQGLARDALGTAGVYNSILMVGQQAALY